MTIPDASRLRGAVSKLARRLRTEGSAESVLSSGALGVLGHLRREGPRTLKELAAAEHMQPPSMTRIVDKLVALELVERSCHPHDRRSVVVSLTDAGDRWIDHTIDHRTSWLAARLDSLPDADLAVLRAAIPVLVTLSELP